MHRLESLNMLQSDKVFSLQPQKIFQYLQVSILHLEPQKQLFKKNLIP